MTERLERSSLVMANNNNNKWPTLWFVCKFCTRAYQEAKDLIGHKKKEHPVQFQQDKAEKKKRRRLRKRNIKDGQKLEGQTNGQQEGIGRIRAEPVRDTIIKCGKQSRTTAVKKRPRRKGRPEITEKKLDSELSPTKDKIFKCNQVDKIGSVEPKLAGDENGGQRSEVTDNIVVCEADSNTLEKTRKFFKNPRRPLSTPQQQQQQQKSETTFPKKIQKASKGKRKKRNQSENPIFCSFCHKTYYSPSGLKCHLRIHTGEKPYKCNLCEQSFTFSAQRIRHRTLCHSDKNNNLNRIAPTTGVSCDEQIGTPSSSTSSTHHEFIFDTNSDTSDSRDEGESNSFMWASMSIFVQRKAIPEGGIMYSCNFCQKEFSILYMAAEHVLTHTHENPSSQKKEKKAGIKDNQTSTIWRPFGVKSKVGQ